MYREIRTRSPVQKTDIADNFCSGPPKRYSIWSPLRCSCFRFFLHVLVKLCLSYLTYSEQQICGIAKVSSKCEDVVHPADEQLGIFDLHKPTNST